jgi:hypothetical protein
MTIAPRATRPLRPLFRLLRQVWDTGCSHEWHACEVFRRTRLITGETAPAFSRLMCRRVGDEWQYRRLRDEEMEAEAERDWMG